MNKFTPALGLASVLLSSSALAAVSEAEVEALRDQIRVLTRRLDELERQNERAADAPERANEQALARVEQTIDRKVNEVITQKVDGRMAGSWTERIRWRGDFRYRYENTDQEGRAERNRSRIRARASLQAELSPTLEVGLGLATGGNDPVSTNQTLGNAGSSKDIRLDLAYFDWSGLRDTHVRGGKLKNFLETPGKSQLLWDSDWRPEGGGISWDNGRFFAHGLGTWLEGDSRNGTEFAWIAQAGLDLGLGQSSSLRFGAGYGQIDVAGRQTLFGDPDNFAGNSFDPVTLTYLNDYHVVEAFAEMKFKLGGRSSAVFADYVQNTEADDNDTGYYLWFKYGAAKKRGTWHLMYAYKRVEADAVLGLLTESDFGGGGTDSKGSILKGSYAVMDGWLFNVSYFLNETGLAGGNPRDFDRVQFDLSFKYD